MPNLKIGVKEHDFLRKIITEKYQQKESNWSPVGNLNNYDNIAKKIRSSVKKRNDSLSVSAYQMQKLFTYNGESTYREDFIEACYLYCDAKRDANALRDDESEVTSAPKTLSQELDFFKTTLQRTENRAEELQKEVDHHIEQNIQMESLLENQKTEFADLEAQLGEKSTVIDSLNHKMVLQNRHQETLKTSLNAYQKQLLFLETKLSQQNIALQHYTKLLNEQQAIAQQTHDMLKQEMESLKEERNRLIVSREVIQKQKNRLFMIVTVLLVILFVILIVK